MKVTRRVSESGGLPARHIDAFLDRLRAAHYSEVTLRKKRCVLCTFSGWMRNRNIDLIDLDESVTARFMKRMIDASQDRVRVPLYGSFSPTCAPKPFCARRR